MAEWRAFDAKYGAAVASGDIDGDWIDEIIIGMGPDPKNPSRVKAVKYDSGQFLETGIDFIAFLRIFSAEGELLSEHLVYPDMD